MVLSLAIKNGVFMRYCTNDAGGVNDGDEIIVKMINYSIIGYTTQQWVLCVSYTKTSWGWAVPSSD